MTASNALRTAACSVPLLVAIATGACGGSTSPCNECPDVSGAWLIQLEPGVDPGRCPGLNEVFVDGPLTLSQVGSGLNTELGGTPMTGTLYDTWDFTLNGSGATDAGLRTLTLTGRYVPAIPAADAGERLQGSFSATLGRDTSPCMVTRGYTARRAP